MPKEDIENKAKQGSFENPIVLEKFEDFRKILSSSWVKINNKKEFFVAPLEARTHHIKGDYLVESFYRRSMKNLKPIKKILYHISELPFPMDIPYYLKIKKESKKKNGN